MLQALKLLSARICFFGIISINVNKLLGNSVHKLQETPILSGVIAGVAFDQKSNRFLWTVTILIIQLNHMYLHDLRLVKDYFLLLSSGELATVR